MTGADQRCALCGRARSTEPPLAALAWVKDAQDAVPRWLCGPCARDNVRAIEGKLPTEHW
ncbi:hypothetical protein ACOBQX_21695 [Actinokineospora sp. G85]|uniref:hypothetical protein n=1 Tax=Actinokineospora sp. G85 TaxID=3406626 RepID=UPI003C740CAA